jgi:hypothetical protein
VEVENTVDFFQKKKENTVDEFIGPDLRVGRGPPDPPSRYATGLSALSLQLVIHQKNQMINIYSYALLSSYKITACPNKIISSLYKLSNPPDK